MGNIISLLINEIFLILLERTFLYRKMLYWRNLKIVRTYSFVDFNKHRERAAIVPAARAGTDVIEETMLKSWPELVRLILIVALIQALQDPNDEVAKLAEESLVNIGTPAVQPLISTLLDGEWPLADLAGETLTQIGAKATKPSFSKNYPFCGKSMPIILVRWLGY
jgi:hypothetical protein